MPKLRYRYNPDTLSYEKVEQSRKNVTATVLMQVGAVVVSAIILLFVFSFFFDTPGERIQRRENKQLVDQYKMLNEKLQIMEKVMTDIELRDDNIYRSIFGVEPIPEEKRRSGYGGVKRYQNLERLNNSGLVIDASKKLDNLENKIYLQVNSYNEIVELAKEKEQFLSSIPAISPIADKDLTRFASGYGFRIHPIYRTRKMHEGIDLTAPTGTAVYATGDGKVIKSGYSTSGYGKRVLIEHGFGYKTLYAHLNEVKVKEGHSVKRGEVIGFVGNTGRSTAPHLHYEVRKNNKPENPVNYYYNDMTPEQYEEMLQVSSRVNMSFD